MRWFLLTAMVALGCGCGSLDIEQTPPCELSGPGRVAFVQLCNDPTRAICTADDDDGSANNRRPLVGCTYEHRPTEDTVLVSLCVERCE